MDEEDDPGGGNLKIARMTPAWTAELTRLSRGHNEMKRVAGDKRSPLQRASTILTNSSSAPETGTKPH
jgi:hypothetical protein